MCDGMGACRLQGLAGALILALGCGMALAEVPRASRPPEPRPAALVPVAPVVGENAAASTEAAEIAAAAAPVIAPAAAPPIAAPQVRDPSRGAVTNLPLPRFVSLKGSEGNARRGPGLAHRIDWVFTRPGMPLKITAEFDNWRRVEDAEGAGGWVHYALLSGVRSVLVTQAMADLRSRPDDEAEVLVRAEAGVVARIVSCTEAWCRLRIGGERAWVRKAAIWGVDAAETLE